jgi:hypothetical protein
MEQWRHLRFLTRLGAYRAWTGKVTHRTRANDCQRSVRLFPQAWQELGGAHRELGNAFFVAENRLIWADVLPRLVCSCRGGGSHCTEALGAGSDIRDMFELVEIEF